MTDISSGRDRERLGHIMDGIASIERLIARGTRDEVANLALERCFITIGEACRVVSKELRMRYPAIPWTSIIGLRNIVTHEYEKLEIDTLWDVAEHKIPALKNWIQGILEHK